MTRKGFTLIELLVVVLIMGILASVAMPQYYKSVEKSRSAEAINALNALAEAIERRIMQKGPSTTLSLIRHFDQLESEIDIGVGELSYFTFDVGRPEVVISGDNNVRLMLKRKDDAGGGLGKYTIQLTYFFGSGQRAWFCSPTSAGCEKLFFARKNSNE